MSERLTRRECLTRGAGAVLGAGAAAVGGYLLYDPEGDRGLPESPTNVPCLKNYFADVAFPPANPRISVATGATQRLEQMVRAAVGGLDPKLGMRRFVTGGDIVLIKPNIGFDRPPHLGATTHPAVVRAIIRLCNEAGAAEVIVTDNPIESPQTCFARSGIMRVSEEEGATIVLPTRGDFQIVAVRDRQLGPHATAAPGLPDCWPVLYEPLARATKVIGIAPVKDHNLCSASMNLKNWYGLLGGRRNQFHQAIHETISDLALLVIPTLVIADATRVMMHNGPTGGRLSDVQPGGVLGRSAVIASVDPVACDAWCYENLLGRDHMALTYLALAHEKIRTQADSGVQRFGDRDWRVYERDGRVVSASL